MAANAGVVPVNDIYAAERDEARAARYAMTEMDRAPRHPHAHLGMCGDRDDARGE
ncbi:hypothetical protein NJBCHELONAE_42830 [Mycobacteroides chelonae]|nr:hypothetical protein NJBCHELONAE_42830 [Mycobacteroides chelonae]